MVPGNHSAQSGSRACGEPEPIAQTRNVGGGTSSSTTGETRPGNSATGGSSIPLHPVATTIPTRQSSLDSDMLSISDRSERINPFLHGPDASIISNEVLHRLLENWQWAGCCPPSSEQSRQSSLATQSRTSATKSLDLDESKPWGTETPLAPLDNNGEPEDGDSGSLQPRKRIKGGLPPRKCLACPFWKKNPRAHRNCFSYKLSRIKDVKQHLARQYTPIHCERCLKTFRDRQSKRKHLGSDDPCVRGQYDELDGVSNEQNEDLRRKSKWGQTESGQWYGIWHILFPDLVQPNSPYMGL
jgi:hypothetical protein